MKIFDQFRKIIFFTFFVTQKFLREAPRNLAILARSAPMVLFSENSGTTKYTTFIDKAYQTVFVYP